MDMHLVYKYLLIMYKHDIIKEDDYAPIVNASDHYPVIVEFTSKENITC